MEVRLWQSGRVPIVIDFTKPLSIASSVAYEMKLLGSFHSNEEKSFDGSEIDISSAKIGSFKGS